MPGEVCRQTSYSMITNLGSPSPIFGTVSNSRFAQCARSLYRQTWFQANGLPAPSRMFPGTPREDPGLGEQCRARLTGESTRPCLPEELALDCYTAQDSGTRTPQPRWCTGLLWLYRAACNADARLEFRLAAADFQAAITWREGKLRAKRGGVRNLRD